MKTNLASVFIYFDKPSHQCELLIPADSGPCFRECRAQIGAVVWAQRYGPRSALRRRGVTYHCNMLSYEYLNHGIGESGTLYRLLETVRDGLHCFTRFYQTQNSMLPLFYSTFAKFDTLVK